MGLRSSFRSRLQALPSGAARSQPASPRERVSSPRAIQAPSQKGTTEMVKYRLLPRIVTASAALVAFSSVSAAGADDAYLQMAKEHIAQVTTPGAPWTGPRTGPKAQGRKLVVYVSSDQRNGGPQGAGDGAQEAAKGIGWAFRVLDGQGSVP